MNLVINFGAGLGGCLGLKLVLKRVILRLDHNNLAKRHKKCRIIKFKFMILYVKMVKQHNIFIKEIFINLSYVNSLARF